MADIIKFPEMLRGNGAREALERVLDAESDLYEDIIQSEGVRESDENHLSLVDRLLTRLWIEGFKIVPVETNDRSD